MWSCVCVACACINRYNAGLGSKHTEKYGKAAIPRPTQIEQFNRHTFIPIKKKKYPYKSYIHIDDVK